MPASTVTCPSCNATLKPKTPVPAGTHIKCPKCTNVFIVPEDEEEAKPAAPRPKAKPAVLAEDEEEDLSDGGEVLDDEPEDDEPDDDRPRRKKKPKKKGGVPVWVWVTTGVVGVLFLMCLGCAGIIYINFPKVEIGAPSASVSMANFDKIKKGMTEAQIKGFMGKPTAAVNIGGQKVDSWNQGPDAITVTFVSDSATQSTCNIGGVSKNGF